MENPETLKFIICIEYSQIFGKDIHEYLPWNKACRKINMYLGRKTYYYYVIILYIYIYIYIHLFFSQCTYMKTIFFQIIAEQFTTASCTFINNILCRKIEIESDNHIYNAAKRISQKFSKKESEWKIYTERKDWLLQQFR